MQRTEHDQLTQLETIRERLAVALIHIGNYEWWLPWLYLVCMVIAELVTSLVQPRLGMLMYLLILLGLSIRDADLPSPATRRFMLGLTLALPLRVLALVLPHSILQPLTWYPAVVLLFLIAALIVIGQVGISRRTLGLEKAKLLLQLWLSSIGFGLGAIEYMILRPRLPLPSITWGTMLLPALNLMLVTGVAEELIFRGVIQSLARRVLGRWTLVYVALLSAVLHLGYLSIADLGFAFVSALLYGFIVRRTQSIVGVALAHGYASIILFLGLPYLAQSSSPRILPLLIAMLVAVSIGGLGVSLLRWLQSPTPKAGPAPSPVTRLRLLRRLYGMTYAELASSTGIPVRELAAIEHGLQPISPERLPQLRQILGEPTVIMPQSSDR